MSPDGAPTTILDPLWIKLPDGAALAARVWLPRGARTAPVPAILEFGPQRRRDGSYLRDHRLHAWHAACGFAGVRIDIRGSGDSDGLLEDQNGEAELRDMLAAMAFVANEPWCNGRLGLIADSWSGPTVFRAAAARPAALRAIVAIGARVDRFAEGEFLRGGLATTAGLMWAGELMAMQARPPDAGIVGPRWRELWRTRLDALPLFAATWLAHPSLDRYWRAQTWQAARDPIDTPVLALAEQGDASADAVLRLGRDLRGPFAATIGPPAATTFARSPQPLEALYVAEARGWWDHWLGTTPVAWRDGPALRIACAGDTAVPPRWFAPSERAATGGVRVLHLGAGRLGDSPEPPGVLMALPRQSRPGGAGVFESAPLENAAFVVGTPRVELTVASDSAAGALRARLRVRAGDGRLRHAVETILNLAQRDGPEAPLPLPVGRLVRVAIDFGYAVFALESGDRVELELLTGTWPIALEPPGAGGLAIHLHDGVLRLPVADARLDAVAGPADAGAPSAGAAPRHTVRRIPADRIVTDPRDPDRIRIEHDAGLVHLDETGVTVDVVGTVQLERGRSATAAVATDWRYRATRGGAELDSRTRLRIVAGQGRFDITAAVDARIGDTPVAQREWRVSVARRDA